MYVTKNKIKLKKDAYCICCKQRLDFAMPSTKYCTNCKIFTTELRNQNRYYKKVINELKLLLYHAPSGSMKGITQELQEAILRKTINNDKSNE